MTRLIILIFVLVLVLLLVPMGLYNRLVRLRNLVRNQFSQIDVQLKRRHDLIPNLVETVKAYMKHERETLEAVIHARNEAAGAAQRAAGNPGGATEMHQLVDAERALTGALGRVFALSEAYPELKANQNLLQLNEELASTENRVSFARQAYNDAVMQYNNARETFPSVLVAAPLGFRAAEPFELEDLTHHEVPQLNLS